MREAGLPKPAFASARLLERGRRRALPRRSPPSLPPRGAAFRALRLAPRGMGRPGQLSAGAGILCRALPDFGSRNTLFLALQTYWTAHGLNYFRS